MEIKTCKLELLTDLDNHTFDTLAGTGELVTMRISDGENTVEVVGSVKKVQTVKTHEDGQEVTKKKVTLEISQLNGALLDIAFVEGGKS